MERRAFIKGAAALGGALAGVPTSALGRSCEMQFESVKSYPVNHNVNYTFRDHEVVDYNFYQLPYLPGINLRGPAVDVEGRTDFFSCLGAAQTLGVYTANPFPSLLAQKSGLAGWNVGIGGAGPSWFLRYPALLDYVNRGQFAILQVMTARNEENDRIEPFSQGFLSRDKKHGDHILGNLIWDRIREEEPENFDRYVQQSVDSWKAKLAELIGRIEVPLVHFWFSPKGLEDEITVGYRSVQGIMDVYPQFITGRDVKDVIGDEPLVVCRSNRNEKFALRDRWSGKPTSVEYGSLGNVPAYRETHNIYYPSPEMHWDAAMVLGEALEKRGLI